MGVFRKMFYLQRKINWLKHLLPVYLSSIFYSFIEWKTKEVTY